MSVAATTSSKSSKFTPPGFTFAKRVLPDSFTAPIPMVIDGLDGTAFVAEPGREQELDDEILRFRATQQRKQRELRVSNRALLPLRDELREAKYNLAKSLTEMKELHVGSGREGRWSKFLRHAGYHRNTADGIVKKHVLAEAKKLSASLNGMAVEPTEDDIAMLVLSLVAKCKAIKSRRLADAVITGITAALASQLDSIDGAIPSTPTLADPYMPSTCVAGTSEGCDDHPLPTAVRPSFASPAETAVSPKAEANLSDSDEYADSLSDDQYDRELVQASIKMCGSSENLIVFLCELLETDHETAEKIIEENVKVRYTPSSV